MKKVLLVSLLFITLFAGLLLGPRLIEYPGYVLIVMEHGTVQLRFFGIVLLFIVLGGVFWMTRRVLRPLLKPSRRQEKLLNLGLLALLEGDPRKSQKLLAKVRDSQLIGLAQIAAGEAALQQGDREQARNHWLQAGEEKSASAAAHMRLLRDFNEQHDYTDALKFIETLPAASTKQKGVIKQWAIALAGSGQWQALQDKLSGWKKPLGSHYAKWLEKTSSGTFSEIASKEGANALKSTWQALPRKTKKDPGQQAAYIYQLIEQGLHHDAESALLDFQSKQPSSELLPQFRKLRLANAASSIRRFESWIKQDTNNVELYSVLGELAFNSGDLVLAEKALQKAIALEKRTSDLRLLAKVKEATHNEHEALTLYKQSL